MSDLVRNPKARFSPFAALTMHEGVFFMTIPRGGPSGVGVLCEFCFDSFGVVLDASVTWESKKINFVYKNSFRGILVYFGLTKHKNL